MPGAAIHLAHDLFVVDPFEELAGQRHARGVAPLPDLIEETVGDQLETLLDQLVVDLALLLDFFRGLELSGETGFELAESDVVEARRVYVISSDATAGMTTQLKRPIDGPVRMLGIVDGCEDLTIHRHLGVLESCRAHTHSRRALGELGVGLGRNGARAAVACQVDFCRREYAPRTGTCQGLAGFIRARPACPTRPTP